MAIIDVVKYKTADVELCHKFDSDDLRMEIGLDVGNTVGNIAGQYMNANPSQVPPLPKSAPLYCLAINGQQIPKPRGAGSDPVCHSQMQSITRNVPFLTGANLLLSVALCYVVAAGAFFIGLQPVRFALPVAFVLALLFTFVLQKNIGRWIASVVISMAVWCAGAAISVALFDSTCDGNLYHMEAVADMYNGWNPYLDTLGVPSDEPLIHHYPKAMEIVGACLMGMTGILQSSKAVMIALAAALCLLSALLTRMVSPQVSRRRSWVLTLLIVSNPVVVCQMLRFYIDDVVYITTVLTLLLSLAILLSDSKKPFLYVLLVATIVIATGTKLNALFYACLTGVCISAGCLVFHRKRHLGAYLCICSLSVIASVFAIAYHPYVTNWLIAGHPLYPLVGEGSIDIMSYNTPEKFVGGNRFINFLWSI